MVHRQRFLRDSMIYAAGQYVLRVLLMARGLVAARLLGPQLYGTWNAIQLVMDYGQLAPMGTFQGLDQTVPPRLHDGDPHAIDRVKRSGLFNVVALTLGYAVGVLLYFSVFATSAGKVLGYWGLAGVAIAMACVFLNNLGQFHVNLLRAHNDIPAIAGWYLAQGLVGAGLALAFVPRFGPWGLLGGWLLGMLVASVITHWRARHITPFVPRPAGESLALLRVGVPMFLYSGSTFIMRTLDRVIILKFLGTLELGYYSLAVTGVTLLLYLPESIAFVIYPQLLRAFHAAGNSNAAIRTRVERILGALAVLVPAMCGLFYLGVRDLIALLLPKFLPGLPAVRIVAFGAGGLAFVGMSAITLMTVRRQHWLIAASFASVAIGAALDLLAVRFDTHIVGVAWATLAAYLLNGALMLALTSAALWGGWGHVPGALARAFTPLALAGALAWGLDHLLPWGGSTDPLHCLARLGLSSVCFLAAYVVVALPFARGLGLRQTLAEMNLPFFRRPGANGGGGTGA